MNLKYTALALLLLNSAFSFSVVNSKAPQQAQDQQVTLSPEEQKEMLNYIQRQIAAFIGNYMEKHNISIAICGAIDGEYVFQINGNQVSWCPVSALNAADLARIPNITEAISAAMTAEINLAEAMAAD